VAASTLKLHIIYTTFNILCFSLQEDISVAKRVLPMVTLKAEAHSAAQLFKNISVSANHNYDICKDISDVGVS